MTHGRDTLRAAPMASEAWIDPGHTLEIVRQEIHEMSAQEGEVTFLSTLSGGENAHLWVGGISRTKRFEPDGDLHGKEALVAEREKALGRHFVQTTAGAPKRCVDGRTRLGYDGTKAGSYGQALGPQVQGGSVDEAAAYELAKDINEVENQMATDFVEAVERYVETHQSDFEPGDHDDDHGGLGCGAVKTMPDKVDMYNDPEAVPVIKSTTTTILNADDKQPTSGVFEKLQANSARLVARKEQYFADLARTVDVLRARNAQAVEKLGGVPHNEMSLTLNFVRGTTFHRDDYNGATEGLVQNFNLDVWNIIDEHPPEVAEILIADAVATLMKLTDGTLNVYARLPVSKTSI